MTKTAVIALSLALALVSYSQFSKSQGSTDLSVPLEVSNMFQSWIAKHAKSYQTPEELLHRLKIFHENFLFVTEHNRNNKGGAVLGLNLFADLHADEFLPGLKRETLEKQEYRPDSESKRVNRDVKRMSQGPPRRRESVNWEFDQQG